MFNLPNRIKIIKSGHSEFKKDFEMSLRELKVFYQGCPLCNSKLSKYLFTTNLFDSFTIYFVRCLNCNAVYQKPILPEKDLMKLYGQIKGIKEFWIRALKQDKKPNGKSPIIEHVRRYKSEGSFLDFGCGIGTLLIEAKKYFGKVLGVEVDDNLIKICKSRGLSVIKSLPENNSLDEKFDVIVLSQVFEHLLEPLPILNKLVKLLKKDGVLYISTPNSNSLSMRIFKGQQAHLVNPGHVIIANNKVFEFLAEKLKLQMVDFRTEKLDLGIYDLLYYFVGDRKKFLQRKNLQWSLMFYLLAALDQRLIEPLFEKTLQHTQLGSYVTGVFSKIRIASSMTKRETSKNGGAQLQKLTK